MKIISETVNLAMIPSQVEALDREIQDNYKEILKLKTEYLCYFPMGKKYYDEEGHSVEVVGFMTKPPQLIVEYNTGATRGIDPLHLKGEVKE